jgi:two-component system sensor histidine kinase/response regulator
VNVDNCKVILVDDDPIIHKAAKYRLASKNIDLISITDPTEAVECIIDNAPDLVVLDWRMPELDGYELAQVIRNTPEICDTNIVFLSGMNYADVSSKVQECNAIGFISKPTCIPRISDQIEQYAYGGAVRKACAEIMRAASKSAKAN